MTGRWVFCLMAAAALGARGAELTGSLRADGSSTVYPLTAAMAEEFGAVKENAGVRSTVAYSGTGGGFKKFCLGEIDLNNASRPIKEGEAELCRKHKIKYLPIPVAHDGITIVTSPRNTFLKSLTFEQLKRIWEPGSSVKTWKDVDPAYPAEAVKLYGPGTDSGTFDYFTEEVMGKARASRADYTASEDDNVLVKGVMASPYALGYFGFSYYLENQKNVKAVPVSHKKGPVTPSNETIADGSYPLSRQIYVYVSDKAASRPEVQAFVRFYLRRATEIAKQVGYTPLKAEAYEKALQAFEKFTPKAKG